MTSFDKVANPEVSLEQTPGRMLRQAREAAGISAQEMASRLNWMPRYITAIEENYYDEMRGTTFVRGYLRAYGKMLGVDEQQLMSAFTAMQLPEEPLVDSARADKQVSIMRRPMMGIAAGIAGAILVVMVFLWWQGDSGQPLNATVATPAVQSTAIQTPAEEEPVEEEVVEEEVVEEEVVEEEVVEEEVVEEDVSVAEITAEKVAVAVEQAVPGDVGDDALLVQAGPLEPVPSSVVAFADALLQFRFSGDCWLEVRDGTEQLIYADLRRTGDELGLDGQPPFTVLVGDSRYVQLHYDGEEFEIQSRPGRVLAKFSVGEQ